MKVCRENRHIAPPIILLLTSASDGDEWLTSCCGHILVHYVQLLFIRFAYLIKFLVSIQGTTGYPKATITTHHIVVNNAIITGKHLELNTEVLYMCVNYVDKKPVEESDSPLTLERAQTQIRVNVLACNDNCRKYATKQERISCIWMDYEVATLQRTDDLECRFLESNGHQMLPITCSSSICPNDRTARSLAEQKWERWISDWDCYCISLRCYHIIFSSSS